MTQQEQFLEVIDRDEAERRFRAALSLRPLGEERVPLAIALGRNLSRDVAAPVDVPMFDRSNFDGFALQARDTFGADEEHPRTLRLCGPSLATGVHPTLELAPGEALPIATGAMVPRGADAILMVEFGEVAGDQVLARRAVAAGFGVTYAGTDISAGEIVLRRGELLTSRETGVLAAIGVAEVAVWRRPRVAIISTGDEIIPPGTPMVPGQIYDSNARILADAVREVGGEPCEMGIVRDRYEELEAIVAKALDSCDAVLLSGGTSKGEGDISYRVVRQFHDPGVVAHGVALKPGKPICLAVTRGKPIVVLPGFPTSAIFTFHEFVAPVLRRMTGRNDEARETVPARLAVKVNSEIGRTEYLLVGLIERAGAETRDSIELAAYPMGKGSGSVTAFSRADGFLTIARHDEIIEAGAVVGVQLLGQGLKPADLVVIGSHCVGLEWLLGELHERGWRAKVLAVGSLAGLDAARRGECDLAGIHLFDPKTETYNQAYLDERLELVPGYGRIQGIVFRPGDPRFQDRSVEEAIGLAIADDACVMVNRNAGSGTRILIDRLLNKARPKGYGVQARNHNAVAAAVAQRRADWGIAIRGVARQQQLGFLPITEERYDFVIPTSRRHKPAVQEFCRLLQSPAVRDKLGELDLRRD